MEWVSALVAAVFSFGGGIFFTLAKIERPVRGLARDWDHPQVQDEDARFVHASLQRLIPLLPPANGVVIVLGTATMLYQAAQLGWNWPSVVVLVFYWLITGYLIVFGNVAGAVRQVRESPSDGEISVVRRGVGRLTLLHHIALFGNLGTVLLQLVLVIAR